MNASAAWNAGDSNLIPKEQAEGKILELAKKQGLRNTFKVLYDGDVIGDPDDLPDMVDMRKVQVSEMLHQATG